MFYNNDEKEEIKKKWTNVFVNHCDKCNGEGFIYKDNIKTQCSCEKKAIRLYKLEISNIPLNYINECKDMIRKFVKYDFKQYFDIILNNAFKTKNIFLYNLPNNLNNMIIEYIAYYLINKENNITKKKISMRYVIYENLVQLSLRSNVDRDARDKLNSIMNKPDILFIDNIGIETGFGSASKHNVKLLQLILKERNNKMKSTIISSKLYFDDIEKYYNKDIIEMITKYDIIKDECDE